MMLCEVDSAVREPRPADLEGEFRVRRGDFVGVVQPHEDKYKFYVRDLRRERPTIHGYRVDFPDAIAAVTQLLNSLTDGR